MKRPLLVSAGVLLVFLVAGEGLLRWYSKRHRIYAIEMARYATSMKVDAANPRIGHVHRPGAVDTLMGVEVRINSDGFRDRDRPIARGGAERIIFLGDSITLGWGVAQPETFASRLEQALSRQRPTEILNFGTGNYNTEQEVNLFLEKGLKYNPDRVVVFYFINDAEPTPAKSRLWFLGYSEVLTFYWARIRALQSRWVAARSFERYYADLYQDDREGWRRAREAFVQLEGTCRERGIRLQVVLLPELHELRQYPFHSEHAKVAEFLRSQGIECLDLAPSFAGCANPRTLWVNGDDAHPNALAHGMIAEAVLPFLAARAEPGR